MKEALLYGDLTIDRNFSDGRLIYEGIGGPPLFMSKMFRILGIQPNIYTNYGTLFPLDELEGAQLYPSQNNEATLLFENSYTGNVRKQTVRMGEKWEVLDLDKLSEEFRNRQDILIVSPLVPNYSLSDFENIPVLFPNSLAVLAPQGLFRRITKDGIVQKGEWDNADEMISLFDIIILSEEDGSNLETKGLEWSRKGSKVVITQAERGCSIFKDGDTVHFPAFEVPKKDVVDSTGAGDIFAATFTYAYNLSADLSKSAIFANAAASLSLRLLPNNLEYTMEDIYKLINTKYKEFIL
ncbi:hypothetical protein COV53_03225 [Candidatus Gottesmanbacteria bacterium CG11_big_fil_rev_8_21_14_0_20_37_11]|uniref:Carbohydrate kinase PfkB domain-containing protein n=3 Tax=Candidatus Gottesmaniibacteriota TaxID=1752720 RepID=A0A2M7RQ08_9BACT|nr:MAG: hypothetical protein AUJ73_04880 [Candidatus Gottesmanbacteria bacterium CG1_02_37_22]PIP33060.1 MAG: hypothetical protein COX23_01430 [Candidatus Gottesmanbacteria bacterium CG23_combo_of_CG06-09_8_20_14_all_37_19]PIR08408.1 MAG: hypothetical protein COV53_03225 [Candidatus Gottesmanbacteria bacterium CG11_big_fil_rev_8_21_14_0_20_37_11]PIZ02260.1 MAG: hypothetical protein COY59_05780 [Candidatus Gottesmanbacteria bacterium CG_4_10_14_0_8_um_filter_37_24]